MSALNLRESQKSRPKRLSGGHFFKRIARLYVPAMAGEYDQEGQDHEWYLFGRRC